MSTTLEEVTRRARYQRLLRREGIVTTIRAMFITILVTSLGVRLATLEGLEVATILAKNKCL